MTTRVYYSLIESGLSIGTQDRVRHRPCPGRPDPADPEGWINCIGSLVDVPFVDRDERGTEEVCLMCNRSPRPARKHEEPTVQVHNKNGRVYEVPAIGYQLTLKGV